MILDVQKYLKISTIDGLFYISKQSHIAERYVKLRHTNNLLFFNKLLTFRNIQILKNILEFFGQFLSSFPSFLHHF